MNLTKAKLCYVSEPWAFFTTQELDKQWGDDWNDAPYEHNAGPPYDMSRTDRELKEKEPWKIYRVAFYGPFETPSSWATNSKYSVEMINKGMVPWICSDRYSIKSESFVLIFAGCTLPEFVKKIEEGNGEVYLPRKLSGNFLTA